jgi:hypothetical protein
MLDHVQRIPELTNAKHFGSGVPQPFFYFECSKRLGLDNKDRAPAERKSVHETTPCWDKPKRSSTLDPPGSAHC